MKRRDLTGQKFGMRTVLHHVRGYYWRVRCDCGYESDVYAGTLKNGTAKSCGCTRKQPPLDGRVFGRLTAVEQVFTESRHVMYACICACGGEAVVQGAALRGGRVKSCGCYRRDLMRSRIQDINRNRSQRKRAA